MQKMSQDIEKGNRACRGERNKHRYILVCLNLTLAFSTSSVCTSLRASGASEVEPELHQTKTRGDVIFIG